MDSDMALIKVTAAALKAILSTLAAHNTSGEFGQILQRYISDIISWCRDVYGGVIMKPN